MRRPSVSEKVFLAELESSSRALLTQQNGLEIGGMIRLFRAQLGMSQRTLSKRSGVPQSTISRVESGGMLPKISLLEKILAALECDLLITAVPRTNLQEVRHKQAVKKAGERLEYLKGTMSLEAQIPSEDFLQEVFEEEVKKILESRGPCLWEEDT